MKKSLLLLSAILCSTVFGQTYLWVNLVSPDYQFNPASLHAPSAIDNSGNPICARLVNYQQTYSSIVYGDIKLEKRNSSGSLIWENTIFGKADISEIVVDSDNNVVCIGTFRDSVLIGSTTLYQTEVNQNSFIFKTDDSGNFLWVLDGTSFAPQHSVISALDLKASNNILVGATNYNVNANIYEFNTNGSLVSTILQTDVETISDINVDISGNVWATGFAFNGPTSFNGLDTIAPFSYNEYVVKYNSAGTAQWVIFVEDVTVQDFNIETDAAGNAYLSGNLFFGTNFGNLVANGPQWVYDFFVTKISPDGNFLWLQEIPPGNSMGDATIGNSNFLFCSNDGNTYLTGLFRGTINFGNGVTLSPVAAYTDLFVLSYSPDGVVQWAKAAGGNTYDKGSGIAGDGNGNLYISGAVSENSVFDTISISGAYMNLFLAKLAFDSPVNVEDQLTSSQSVADEYLLMQNYPNPFNPSTKIRFTIPSVGTQRAVSVQLKVYDVLGNEVATLVDEDKPAGTYEVEFNSHSGEGQNLPAGRQGLTSGLYFYTLKVDDFSHTKKMILIK